MEEEKETRMIGRVVGKETMRRGRGRGKGDKGEGKKTGGRGRGREVKIDGMETHGWRVESGGKATGRDVFRHVGRLRQD